MSNNTESYICPDKVSTILIPLCIPVAITLLVLGVGIGMMITIPIYYALNSELDRKDWEARLRQHNVPYLLQLVVVSYLGYYPMKLEGWTEEKHEVYKAVEKSVEVSWQSRGNH